MQVSCTLSGLPHYHTTPEHYTPSLVSTAARNDIHRRFELAGGMVDTFFRVDSAAAIRMKT